MQVLSFKAEELVRIVNSSKPIRNGYNGVLFLYNNQLLKLDKSLFEGIFGSSLYSALEKIKRYIKTDTFARKDQVSYLFEKQQDIKLTDFDLGVIEVEGVVVGTILPNHLDYNNLADLKIRNQKEAFLALKIMYALLAAIRELDLNDINVLDLINNTNSMNVLYKDTDVKICDLEGMFVTYNRNSQKAIMYHQYYRVLVTILDRLIKFNPKAMLIKELLVIDEKNLYESFLSFLNLFERFLIEDVAMFGLSDEDIAYTKKDLKGTTKKVLCNNLTISKRGLNGGFNLPTEAVYGTLVIEGEGTLDNVLLPRTIYGNFRILDSSKLKNLVMPLNVKGYSEMRGVKELDNVTFSPNYSFKESLITVKKMKNMTLPDSDTIGFDFRTLDTIDNVTLPREIFNLFIPMIKSLKGVTLPKIVHDCLIISDFQVLDGAIVPDDVENYAVVTSFGRFNLFDIIEKASCQNVDSVKRLTIKSKYDII